MGVDAGISGEIRLNPLCMLVTILLSDVPCLVHTEYGLVSQDRGDAHQEQPAELGPRNWCNLLEDDVTTTFLCNNGPEHDDDPGNGT